MTGNFKGTITDSFYWVTVSSAFSRSLTMLTTLILAAILAPDDFGVVSVANLITASLGLFRDFGMNQAIIYQKKNVSEAADTTLVISATISLFLFLIGWLLARPAAVFFNNPAVEDVMKVLPFSLVITAFSSIPTSLMEKEMAFKRRAVPEVLSFLAYFVVCLVLAWYGFKYWSIIFGYLALCIVGLVATFAVSPWHPTLRFHPFVLKELAGFGSYAMSSTTINFVIRNIDSVSVGRILGTATLGYYDIAYRMGNVVATQISHAMSKVLYPAFIKMGSDLSRVRDTYLMAYRWLAIINIPLAVGIVWYIPHFFHLFYNGKWDKAILCAQILTVYGLFRSLFSHAGALFMSMGKVREVFWLNLGQLALMLMGIVPVVRYLGISGLASFIASLNFICIVIICFLMNGFFPAIARELINQAIRPLLVSIAVIGLPYGVWIWSGKDMTFFFFFGLILVSILLYISIMLLIVRDIKKELRYLAVNIFSR